MLRVVLIGSFSALLHDAVRRHLRVPCDLVLTDEAGAPALLAEADAAVTVTFTAEMGRVARKLRLLQVSGAGINGIDRAALPEGAALANCFGHETGIAEYILGAMLLLNRPYREQDAALRQGQWIGQYAIDGQVPTPFPELGGQTLGILGYGRIGAELAKRARAFDMEVLAIRSRAHNTPRPPELALLSGPEALEEVLRRADYVAVTLPLTPQTEGLLNAARLALLKPSAVLINVARGHIVEEDALYEALAAGRLRGAALDAWWRYPTPDGQPTLPARRPFHELPNVLMTPHASAWTQRMIDNRGRLIAENLARLAEGQALMNEIAR